MRQKLPRLHGRRRQFHSHPYDRRRSEDRRVDKRNNHVHERAAKKLTRRMHQQEVASHLSNIALANPHFGRFMNEALSYLTRSLDVEFAKILEFDEERKCLVLRAGVGWGLSMKVDKTSFEPKTTLAGRTLASKKPIVIEDLREEKKVKQPAHLQNHKVISGMSVLIPGLKRPFGVLGIYSKRKRIFSEDDVNFLQSVANVIALAYRRTITENELRRFQYMADNANVGISLIDKHGTIKYANRITYERLGFTREEYMKKRVLHKESSESPPRFKELFNLIQKKMIPPIETYEVKKGGKSSVPLEMNLTGVTFEGEPYMFAVSQDITSRQREMERVSFLVEASLILGSSLNYGETLDMAAKIAVPTIADWCSIEMYDENGSVELIAIAHKDPKKVDWAKKLRRKMLADRTNSKMPAIVRSGKPELYQTITDKILRAYAQSPAHLKLLRAMNLKSAMVVPIRISRNIIGAIHFIISDSDRWYDRTDLAIATELANRAALAIENSRLYQQIEANKEQLDKLIANVPGIVWEIWKKQNPAENRVNFESDYAEKMLGYSMEDWRKPGFWLTVIHPDDRKRVKEEHEAMLADGKGMVQRFRWIHKSGHPIWVESHISIITDSKGKIIGMRGVTMDASERVDFERRKDEFISMASHELKTPVTTLKVFTQILQKHAEKERDATGSLYLSKMDSQILRLTELINDLLDLSKIQTGKLSFVFSKFNPNDLVTEIVEQIQPTTDQHTIKIIGRTAPNLIADRDRLGQVLINLLTNAIKYSPKSDTINIHLSHTKRFATIAIQDFGIGISADQQKKIFSRFYQVTEGDQKMFPGLGIGLYISDEIVRRHGGKIDVKSAEGKGSLFTISLPITGPERSFTSKRDKKIALI